jgi:hypothetical protein
MEEPIEMPPVPVDPPWVTAALATAPPPTPEMQGILDEIELEESRGKDKIARNFRMAYAATVTLHDVEGESIHTIHYGRMPKGDVRGLCRGLARDITAMRAQPLDLKVAYLTDGASEFETLYDQHLKMPLGPEVVSLVDFWHAAEYLGAAARVFEIKRKARAGQFRRWRHALKHEDGTAARIVEQLEQSGLEKVMLDGVRPVEAAIRYFRARLARMDYAGARPRRGPSARRSHPGRAAAGVRRGRRHRTRRAVSEHSASVVRIAVVTPLGSQRADRVAALVRRRSACFACGQYVQMLSAAEAQAGYNR